MPITRDSIPNGLIEVDSEWAGRVGFTSDIFLKGGQLYKQEDCMYIQSIEVLLGKRKKGHFNKLLDRLWELGFVVKVPNPLPTMVRILTKKGFRTISEQDL